MKRSQELIELTREHHHALVLARRAIVAAREASAARALAAELTEIFSRELEPHFLVEEEKLLPALRDAGQYASAARTLDEHRQLRALAQAGAAGEMASLLSFGLLLEAHVRFEERELFPLAETILPAHVLAAVAAGTVAKPRPHPSTTTGV
jgi:hemerythrin-like domain-containing protein